MARYNGQPFIVKRDEPARVPGWCPACKGAYLVSEMMSACVWGEDSGSFGLMHPECARHHPMNLQEMPEPAPSDETHGTQRQSVEFMHQNPGVFVMVRYDPKASRSVRYTFRLSPQ